MSIAFIDACEYCYDSNCNILEFDKCRSLADGWCFALNEFKFQNWIMKGGMYLSTLPFGIGKFYPIIFSIEDSYDFRGEDQKFYDTLDLAFFVAIDFMIENKVI